MGQHATFSAVPVVSNQTGSNSPKLVKDLRTLNADFLNELISALAMDHRSLTALPSLIFLITSMFVVHFVTHKRNFIRGNSWKQITFREIIFQWAYYYITRIWLWFMKILKYTDTYVQNIMASSDWSTLMIHVVFLTLYTCVSFLPALIIFNERFNRPVIPNFMVWVGAHRWERTEMGVSGYYLDRPLRYIPLRPTTVIGNNAYRSVLPSYRTRRSCSADHAELLQHMQQTAILNSNVPGGRPRHVRSMEHLAPISSLGDLVSRS